MDFDTVIKLMEKYSDCPKCGNEYIGNGQGGIVVEENTFTRWCRCGFDITINKDDEIVKENEDKCDCSEYEKYFEKGQEYGKCNKCGTVFGIYHLE